MRTVTVIGAGPAGMMAALSAAKEGADVTVLEKNEKTGKKLYITGKGRCNLTNDCTQEEFFENVVSNKKFLFSAYNSFCASDTISFFEDAGLALKKERGKRIFPASDKSSDVIRTLEDQARKAGVKIKLMSEVKSLDEIKTDAVIVATGGLSYPSTGSTGDGYRFAKEIGHDIVPACPSLCAISVRESFVKDLEGLSLRNVAVKIKDENKKTVFEDFGEMLFAENAVSGPVILTASGHLARKINESPGRYTLHIDLKSALDEASLDKRILRDFGENINREFKNSLGKLLPSKMIDTVVSLSRIDPAKRVNSVTKAERTGLVRLLKDLTLTLESTLGFDRAVVTKGGVNVKEIDPKTMRSKIDPRVYFAGEVIDVDALTGGFNIQIALSTGHLAGISAAKEEI